MASRYTFVYFQAEGGGASGPGRGLRLKGTFLQFGRFQVPSGRNLQSTEPVILRRKLGFRSFPEKNCGVCSAFNLSLHSLTLPACPLRHFLLS